MELLEETLAEISTTQEEEEEQEVRYTSKDLVPQQPGTSHWQ